MKTPPTTKTKLDDRIGSLTCRLTEAESENLDLKKEIEQLKAKSLSCEGDVAEVQEHNLRLRNDNSMLLIDNKENELQIQKLEATLLHAKNLLQVVRQEYANGSYRSSTGNLIASFLDCSFT